LSVLDPIPEQNSTDRAFGEDYYRSGYTLHKRQRLELARESARRVSSQTSEHGGKRLLDVGCGLGYFLNAMGDLGWDAHGLETSRYAADFAEKGGNAKIHFGELDEERFDAESFDLITFFSVIGHIPDPFSIIDISTKLLKPGGWMVFQFPNFDSPWHRFNLWLSNRRSVNRLHIPSIIYRFGKASITRTLEDRGMVVERVDTVNQFSTEENWKLRIARKLMMGTGNVIRSRQEYVIYARKSV